MKNQERQERSSVRAGDAGFQVLMARAVRHRLLTKKEERALMRRAKRGDEKALHELTLTNVRLLLHLANKYSRWGRARGKTLQDLFNEAWIGFQTAVDRFDLRRDVRLSTYAAWWVRHAITRSIEDTGATIRLPVHLQQVRGKIEKHRNALHGKLQRPPTIEEIAGHLGLTPEKVRHALNAPANPVSLDAPIPGNDGTLMPLDVYRDAAAESRTPIEELDERARSDRLKVALRGLTDLEREILSCRFEDELTLVKTAKKLAPKCRHGRTLSRERIRQLQESALAKLRSSLADLAPNA